MAQRLPQLCVECSIGDFSDKRTKAFIFLHENIAIYFPKVQAVPSWKAGD